MWAINIIKNKAKNGSDVKAMVQFLSKLKYLEDSFFVNKDDPKVGNFKNTYLELEKIFPMLPDEYKDKLREEFNTIEEDIEFIKGMGNIERLDGSDYNRLQSKIEMFIGTYNGVFSM